MTPPLDLDRLEGLAAVRARPHRCSAHADMRWGCLVCDPEEEAMEAVWEHVPHLLRIARAAEALVMGVEREALVPPPLVAALRAAFEGREPPTPT